MGTGRPGKKARARNNKAIWERNKAKNTSPVVITKFVVVDKPQIVEDAKPFSYLPIPDDWSVDFIKSVDFLSTYQWKRLRMSAFVLYGNKCMCCGASANDIKLNVDHILPRKTNPELCLTLSNLQILCEDCNCGKGNHFKTSWK